MTQVGFYPAECPACGATIKIPIHIRPTLYAAGDSRIRVRIHPDIDAIRDHLAVCNPGPGNEPNDMLPEAING